MYLKRIELHGFKSFADKVNVTFQPGITGIVGPNGCGKSNISDAVRWVLGEQGVKSLRGSSMVDVIFKGSQDRKAQNVAEVSLVFDNSDHHMKIDYDEVEITRRLYRQNNEAEYLLNRQQCRLKDIVDLIMDTGLGKDSLSIISQGNISSFADSKPDERRGIFEEAAGVAKYKKRKLESIRKLERTTTNLERVKDIVTELEKQLTPLRKQKEKAEKYLELKEQLTDIEVRVLVKEISQAKVQLDQTKEEMKSLYEQQVSTSASITTYEQENEGKRNKMFTLDNEVNALQTRLFEIVNTVSKLETTRIEVDQKRKQLLENQDEQMMQEQIVELKQILSEALAEYNDRVERLQLTQTQIKELTVNQSNVKDALVTCKNEIDSTNEALSKNKSKKEMLQEALESKSNLNHGVKVILSMAKHNPDIIGVFEELVEFKKDYEVALYAALGNAIQFIVTKNDQSAREAIAFLHKNKAGRVTFLPVETMKPRSVKEEHLLVCSSMTGYLGVATDFVEASSSIHSVVYNQLGNIIFADTIENANKISKATFMRYKVVTLSGDVVNVGGSMTGGSNRRQHTTLEQKRELDIVSNLIIELEAKLVSAKNKVVDLENQNRETAHELLQKQMSYAQLEVVAQTKKDKLVSIKSQYETVSQQQVELNDFTSGKVENNLINELNEAYKMRDDLSQEIKSKRTLRMNYVEETDVLETKLKELRKIERGLQEKITTKRVDATKIESSLTIALQRLNEEYSMTYEFAYEGHYDENVDVQSARQEVQILRNQVDALGHVNVDAIQEYEDVNERFTTMDSQRLELLQAQDRILDAIRQMDDIMIERFSDTFEKINIEFNTVFRNLFGGGKANITYTDPSNILETGIDIDIQLPGKTVQNISLFSGGEKALIALSCLFAILKVRPVPMCILDEVEAALDIANVERFAKYLREFAKTTQFIVVTHREGMMEECDILYGATMQQKGVTKLVSVRLEEAVDLTTQG